MTIEELHFNNGLHAFFKEKSIRVKTIREAQNEDWKTALAHGKEPIPADEHLDAEVYHNFYGAFLKVRYKAWWYYLNPKDCDFIGF